MATENDWKYLCGNLKIKETESQSKHFISCLACVIIIIINEVTILA